MYTHKEKVGPITRLPFALRVTIYTAIFCMIWPLGAYMMYRDQEIRERKWAAAGIGVVGLFALIMVLSLMIELLKAVGLIH